MAERIFELSSNGDPVMLGVTLPAGRVYVQVSTDPINARVRLSTAGSSGPTADAIHAAEVTEDEQCVTLTVPGVGDHCPPVIPIVAVVDLPPRSSLFAQTTSGDVDISGDLDRVHVRSVSGNVRVCGVYGLSVRTTSGNIIVGHLADFGIARSACGDVRIASYSGACAGMSTRFGNITVHATDQAFGTLRVQTISGDIRVAGGHRLRVESRTVSGRVRSH